MHAYTGVAKFNPFNNFSSVIDTTTTTQYLSLDTDRKHSLFEILVLSLLIRRGL